MLLYPPGRYHKPRAGVRPALLSMVSASYDAGSSVTLKFNRSIDIAAIAVNSFTLSDGPNGHLYVGQSAALVDPATVAVTLLQVTTASGPSITLDVDDANGIKSLPDGQAWPGVGELVLPFP